jgi:hypothetical protein
MVGLGSSSKKAIQRQFDRVWKAVWETLKRTNIVEEYKDQEVAKAKTFYTPPNSPS